MLSSGKRYRDRLLIHLALQIGGQNFTTQWTTKGTLAEHLPKNNGNGLYDVYKVAKTIKMLKRMKYLLSKLNEFVNRFNQVAGSHRTNSKTHSKIGTMVGAHFGSLGAIAGS